MPTFEDVALQHLLTLTANPQADFGGKSAVYFIATRLLRQEGAGPTVIVSPLLVLMRNQMEMADRLGIRAGTRGPRTKR